MNPNQNNSSIPQATQSMLSDMNASAAANKAQEAARAEREMRVNAFLELQKANLKANQQGGIKTNANPSYIMPTGFIDPVTMAPTDVQAVQKAQANNAQMGAGVYSHAYGSTFDQINMVNKSADNFYDTQIGDTAAYSNKESQNIKANGLRSVYKLRGSQFGSQGVDAATGYIDTDNNSLQYVKKALEGMNSADAIQTQNVLGSINNVLKDEKTAAALSQQGGNVPSSVYNPVVKLYNQMYGSGGMTEGAYSAEIGDPTAKRMLDELVAKYGSLFTDGGSSGTSANMDARDFQHMVSILGALKQAKVDAFVARNGSVAGLVNSMNEFGAAHGGMSEMQKKQILTEAGVPLWLASARGNFTPQNTGTGMQTQVASDDYSWGTNKFSGDNFGTTTTTQPTQEGETTQTPITLTGTGEIKNQGKVAKGVGGKEIDLSYDTGKIAEVKKITSKMNSDIAKQAIAQIESSGKYSTLGKVMEKGDYKGDRAYGKYQIMGKNVTAWSKELLGKAITPQEFLADPKLQDKLAFAKMDALYKQYGNWADVASAWHSGRPLDKAAAQGANDTLTSTYDYVTNRFLGAAGLVQNDHTPKDRTGFAQGSNPFLNNAKNPSFKDQVNNGGFVANMINDIKNEFLQVGEAINRGLSNTFGVDKRLGANYEEDGTFVDGNTGKAIKPIGYREDGTQKGIIATGGEFLGKSVGLALTVSPFGFGEGMAARGATGVLGKWAATSAVASRALKAMEMANSSYTRAALNLGLSSSMTQSLKGIATKYFLNSASTATFWTGADILKNSGEDGGKIASSALKTFGTTMVMDLGLKGIMSGGGKAAGYVNYKLNGSKVEKLWSDASKTFQGIFTKDFDSNMLKDLSTSQAILQQSHDEIVRILPKDFVKQIDGAADTIASDIYKNKRINFYEQDSAAKAIDQLITTHGNEIPEIVDAAMRAGINGTDKHQATREAAIKYLINRFGITPEGGTKLGMTVGSHQLDVLEHTTNLNKAAFDTIETKLSNLYNTKAVINNVRDNFDTIANKNITGVTKESFEAFAETNKDKALNIIEKELMDANNPTYDYYLGLMKDSRKQMLMNDNKLSDQAKRTILSGMENTNKLWNLSKLELAAYKGVVAKFRPEAGVDNSDSALKAAIAILTNGHIGAYFSVKFLRDALSSAGFAKSIATKGNAFTSTGATGRAIENLIQMKEWSPETKAAGLRSLLKVNQ